MTIVLGYLGIIECIILEQLKRMLNNPENHEASP
jgi:hypothetical protein